MSVSGISEKKLANYQASAERLIATYDANRDGLLDASEREAFLGQQVGTETTRTGDSDWVTRTTIYYDRFSGIKEAEFRRGDANQDGKLSRDELVDAYLARRDTNNDGRLGWWERFKAYFNSLPRQFEDHWRVETKRESRLVYSPLPRPTPPSSGIDRPTPPDSGSDRPTPPSGGDDRPTPPPAD
jgi:hypothetical protein